MRSLSQLVITVVSLLFLSILLSGCAGRTSVSFGVHFISSIHLNPNSKGDPSPIQVRYFELTSPTSFENSSYFALNDPHNSELQQDLLALGEVSLAPGEEKQLSKKLNPATRYVGFVAGYRDINQSQWRAIVEVKAHHSADYMVRLNRNTITVSDMQDVAKDTANGPGRFDF